MGMFLGGWLVMVGVAMLPATLPAARLVGVARGHAHAFVFLSGYATVWIAIGAVGYLVFSPLSSNVRWAGAGVALAVTAAYELSPVKEACLRRCRSPLRILLQPTLVGAVRHAVDCAGCCVFLMALMVALGLMSIVWALVLAAVLLVQKAAPFGERSPRLLASGLAAAALVSWI